MEIGKSAVSSYPKAYRFMKKTRVQKSHATVPLKVFAEPSWGNISPVSSFQNIAFDPVYCTRGPLSPHILL